MNINQLLELTIVRGASDLHLLVGYAPHLRINGELIKVPGHPDLIPSDLDSMLQSILTPPQLEMLQKKWELDLGLDYQNTARFRVNIYKQRSHYAASFRLIPSTIRTIPQTGLPESVAKIVNLRQGLVLVTGPTGNGKSTTLAAFINQLNQTEGRHIITVEDPIEFVYPKAKALVSQREILSDTLSWDNALKYALREDPDVVLIGEMRDLETIAAAMTIAETGHLVFATLHTNSAAQTVDRVIDVFPENQQPQIRSQFASVIEAIISLRLVPTIRPGRAMASEIAFGVPALRSVIRDNKTHLIDNMIQTSGEYGMRLLETSLVQLVKEGLITIEVAQNYSLRPQVLNRLLKT